MRIKILALPVRAAIGGIDAVGSQAGVEQLEPGGLAQIGAAFSTFAPFDGCTRAEDSLEFSQHVLAHLERLAPDARADGGEQRSRRRLRIDHAAHGGRDDTGDDSAPAGVHRRDHPAVLAAQEQRNAIGGANRHGARAVCADDRIRPALRIKGSPRLYPGHRAIVDLVNAQRRDARASHDAQQQGVILADALLLVAPFAVAGIAQVQRIERRGTDTPVACAEGVAHTDRFESGRSVEDHTIGGGATREHGIQVTARWDGSKTSAGSPAAKRATGRESLYFYGDRLTLKRSEMHTQETNAPSRRRIGLFPGQFDPITNGHLDVIRRGVGLFDLLIVAVGINPEKTELFHLNERVAMIRGILKDIPAVQVEKYTGLTVDFARRVKATAMLRGIRDVSDLRYELQLALANRTVGGIETVFIMTGDQYALTSSSLIRQVVSLGGDIRKLQGVLPEVVIEKLRRLHRSRKVHAAPDAPEL